MQKSKSKRKADNQFDIGLLMITLCLVGFGLLMIYSTSAYSSQVIYKASSTYFLSKQIKGVIVGLVLMLVVSSIHYRLYIKKIVQLGEKGLTVSLISFIYITAACLQTAVLIWGRSVNGAKRWLDFFGFSLQPAEVTKISVILVVAYFIHKKPWEMNYVRGILKVMLVVMPLLILVIVENLSSAIVIAGIAIGMCFIAAKERMKYFVIFAVMAVLVILFINFGEGFRIERFDIWREVETHPKGFQILQGLYAIASGGVFGTGLGESMQKLGFIPEAHNDMIFAIVCEELGMVGAGIVILMFGLLIWRIFRVSMTSPDLFSGMICTGVMIHIALQVIINIAVVTNSIPSTGIPLPFISYGGTSVSILLAELGLVLGISARRKVS
ncbi:MAG: putative lipid II flippase FtsW [Lachnoclostridium sp.]|nr:putative lipid II flippase FtsW [Lachnoclostridium sp.]